MNEKQALKTEPARAEKTLRDIVLQQYLLHELKHCGNLGGEFSGSSTIEPVAHTMQDIYKCLHQAEFGVGHLIDEPRSFHERLLREILRAAEPSDEPLLECISLDGSTLRLNLRPYRKLFEKEEERAAEILSGLCFESAMVEKGKPDRFVNMLMKFRELNGRGELAFGNTVFKMSPEKVDLFVSNALTIGRRTGNIPVYSHSPEYRRFNKPSYRVVYLEALKISPLSFTLEQKE